MGHYRAEMVFDSDEAKQLRKKYLAVRKRLEQAKADRFTVIEFMQILQLLSKDQTPRDFDKKAAWYVREQIKNMEKLLDQKQNKKSKKE